MVSAPAGDGNRRLARARLMRFATRNLRVSYPAQAGWAVDGVDLDISPGQITWLTGALGSGTSTLLLALAGLVPRITGGTREGSVSCDDTDPSLVAPLGRGIAYLGPSPSLQISGIAATVRDEVAVGPMNLGRSRDEILYATACATHQLHLDHLTERKPDALSGGETQRMLLASLLATSPSAWLLDEPFSALDRASTHHVQQLLRDCAAAGATVVVACDDADVMLAIADRMIVMQRGRVALDGDPQDLLAGDAIMATGTGITDAATLASDAGIRAPRPLTREDLLARISREPAPVARDATATSTSAAVRPGVSSHVTPTDANALEGCPSPSLRMNNVAFAYGTGGPVLHGVSLQVFPAQAVGLFGANGAGKSTLLRLAMALERPTSGSVTTLGASTGGRHPEDFAPKAGFLFQEPERQLFAASVRAECSLAPRLAGWSASRIETAVAAVLDELGLTETAGEHPYDLPLPLRRLVALAAVLAADPDLLLLDEPTAALDFASRERVIRVIRERTRRGKAVLAITHDAGFAHEALQRGMILDGGRLVHDGPIRSVIDDERLVRPAALTVALAIGLPAGADRREEVAGMLRFR
jgi:energy-coupling factor transport system ATP-binding protein